MEIQSVGDRLTWDTQPNPPAPSQQDDFVWTNGRTGLHSFVGEATT
jgi:hypothetical protein